ncbi:MAG: hypothetical protein LBV12_08730 [Puniceicoccales bacterium]|jgi:hypothetical protein|nr:hypothetical protein [Puniceicoccales bacterium]
MSLKITDLINKPVNAMCATAFSVGTSKVGEAITDTAQNNAEQFLGIITLYAGAVTTVLISAWWILKWITLISVKYRRWKNHRPLITEDDLK